MASLDLMVQKSKVYLSFSGKNSQTESISRAVISKVLMMKLDAVMMMGMMVV